MSNLQKKQHIQCNKKIDGAAQYWKMQKIELEKQGIKIKIRHERIFTKKVVVKLPNNKGQLTKSHFKENVIIMTKAQKRFTVLNGYPLYDGYEIQNYGGCTTISLLKDDKEVGIGISRVNKSDNFIRYYGLAKAIQRAIKDMKKKLVVNNYYGNS